MSKQFSDVGCKYGAPMGRQEYGITPDTPRSIRLFRVRMVDGDYDDGGAYWGGGIGTKPLYCAESAPAWDGDMCRRFVRADSRADAIEKLSICAECLVTQERRAQP